MKILYLITKSNWGGAQKYVYDLATTFAAQGLDVVVGFGGQGELKQRLEEKNIRTLTLSSLQRDINVIKELKSIFLLYKVIKNEHPDILHLNSSKAAGLGAFLGRLLNINKIVFTVHGAPFREDRSFVSRRLMYFFTWLTCLLSHKVITVSKQDEYDIARMPFVAKKVATIYNGILFTDIPKPPSSQSRIHHIVSIGDLTKNKGYLYGLAAVNMLVKKGYPIKYSIEGDGEDRAQLEKYVTDNMLHDHVTFLGRTLRTGERLHEFDFFLLSSVKEGLPYVLLEAGRAMMPVVTTITGGIPEIVRHEETGLLAPTKNIEQIALSLERFIQDREFAKKVGQQLRAHVVQHFSHSKMIAETGRLYGLV